MSIPLTDVHIAEITVRGILAADGSDFQHCVNVFHFRRTSTSVDPVITSIRAAFATAILTPWKALVSDDWDGTLVGVRYPEDAEHLEDQANVAGGVVGAIATDRLPDHVAISMLMRSSRRGRSFRGAKRFSGIPEASTTKDTIAAGSLAAWTALAASILAGFTDSTGNIWVPCVLSRKLSQLIENPTTVETSDVTTVLLNKNLGSCNSRKVATVR
jgi:hypothetical protein